MEIPVLYEDANYLIINKPAGLMVHADGRSKGETLVDWIRKNRPEIEAAGETEEDVEDEAGEIVGETKETKGVVDRPGIVHRLDRDTSGALVIVKTPEAFADLKEKFAARDVRKTYHAVVVGALKEDDGMIDRPIGRSVTDFRRRSAGRGAKGELREAVTRWHVLARGVLGGEPVTFVEVFPKTGRTHQIRVHFKSIHHPIVGDALYDRKRAKILGSGPVPIDRVALHAFSIAFVGLGGKKISATAPYPEDFARVVERVKKGGA